MPKNNFILAQEWFCLADNDELAAETLLKEGVAPSTVCFLSQQCAEKYLKGLLAFLNMDVVKVHDLSQLVNLIKKSVPEIVNFTDEFVLLNKYYIQTRYLSDVAEGFDCQEAKAALSAAKNVKKFVLDQIIPC
ncbi:MAG TPA: HEPN domain-containing protein [Candidatus Pacearchaeota archaeon]|jgi:HEPN domain-containing protein|nr:HEPN domain-containing protein [Candidatus Pacearchaeota archaeon]